MATKAAPSRLPVSQLHGRRILVCLDGSKFSEVCVLHAISLAETFGSTITLVHVLEPHREHRGPETHDALAWEITRQEARGYLERLQDEVSGAVGQPVDVRIEQGRPAERIIDLAREIDADLTVLGSHGEGGARSRSLGSTVQQVLALAQSSVFIAHSSSSAGNAVVTPMRILVPLDGSLRTESVLPAAARIANGRGAELLLVHVVQEPLPTALLTTAEDTDLAQKLAARLESGAKRYLEHLRQQLGHEGMSVRTLVVRHPNAHQCLLELSQRERSDLIVLSAHGASCDSARSFGSVAAYLLTHSLVPLLVLQDLPESELQRAPEIGPDSAPPSLRASYPPESV
jgi:nucleotide-binding universal stress UspA family protein